VRWRFVAFCREKGFAEWIALKKKQNNIVAVKSPQNGAFRGLSNVALG
jgi:hypothetical protein